MVEWLGVLAVCGCVGWWWCVGLVEDSLDIGNWSGEVVVGWVVVREAFWRQEMSGCWV